MKTILDKMMENELGIKKGKKKKRPKLTPRERIYIWERPKKYGRKCSICEERITKISDLELDHTKAYSKGGTKMRLAHRDCNRMKGSKGLKYVQKKLAIKPHKKTKNKSARKPKPKYAPGFAPIK